MQCVTVQQAARASVEPDGTQCTSPKVAITRHRPQSECSMATPSDPMLRPDPVSATLLQPLPAGKGPRVLSRRMAAQIAARSRVRTHARAMQQERYGRPTALLCFAAVVYVAVFLCDVWQSGPGAPPASGLFWAAPHLPLSCSAWWPCPALPGPAWLRAHAPTTPRPWSMEREPHSCTCHRCTCGQGRLPGHDSCGRCF